LTDEADNGFRSLTANAFSDDSNNMGQSMSEKEEADEFEDEDAEDVVDAGDDVDIDHLFRDMEKRKKGAVKVGDPAWRRLEKYREERHTAELVSDFDDYDIYDGDSEQGHRRAG
jgi:hypothetical protein